MLVEERAGVGQKREGGEDEEGDVLRGGRCAMVARRFSPAFEESEEGRDVGDRAGEIEIGFCGETE